MSTKYWVYSLGWADEIWEWLKLWTQCQLEVHRDLIGDMSLKHILFVLRRLKARIFGRALQLHFLSGSNDGFFYIFSLGVRAIERHVGCLSLSFPLFLNSRKLLSFPSFSFYIHFFLGPNHFSTMFALKMSSQCLCAIDENLSLYKLLSHNVQIHFLLM